MTEHKYSPDTHAAAATSRMVTVLHLAEEVISGKVSPAAAKLSLMAGGYDDRVVDQIDALEPDEAIGQVPDRWVKGQAKLGKRLALVIIHSDHAGGPMETIVELGGLDGKPAGPHVFDAAARVIEEKLKLIAKSPEAGQ